MRGTEADMAWWQIVLLIVCSMVAGAVLLRVGFWIWLFENWGGP